MLFRSWSPTSFESDSVMEFGFEPICDQLRTSFEPDVRMDIIALHLSYLILMFSFFMRTEVEQHNMKRRLSSCFSLNWFSKTSCISIYTINNRDEFRNVSVTEQTLPSSGMHMPWVTYLRLTCTHGLAGHVDACAAAATVQPYLRGGGVIPV